MNWKYFIQIWLLIVVQTATGQDEIIHFSSDIKKGNYYLLNGTIDEKYQITMKLQIHNSPSCGDEWLATQWKNGAIEGWYCYDRTGEKIKLVGSYLNYKEVSLFVPNTAYDTINNITCEMENYREKFWNYKDFDLTTMNWKLKNSDKTKLVSLSIDHKPAPDTLFLSILENNKNLTKINISELLNQYELNGITVLSQTKYRNVYHVLIKLENNGWREYQSYIGHISINNQFEILNSEALLEYDSWKVEKENIVFDLKHPEKGVKKAK